MTMQFVPLEACESSVHRNVISTQFRLLTNKVDFSSICKSWCRMCVPKGWCNILPYRYHGSPGKIKKKTHYKSGYRLSFPEFRSGTNQLQKMIVFFLLIKKKKWNEIYQLTKSTRLLESRSLFLVDFPLARF